MNAAKPRGPLGCLLVCAGLVALVGGLLAAAVFGLTWYHYTNTPDFLEYIRSRPVDIGILDERIGGGDLLADDDSWKTGELDPWTVSHKDPVFEQVSLTLDIDLEHADDSLLQLRQRFLFVFAREDWEHRGFRIETPQLQTHRDMRAHVLVYLGDVENFVGAGSQGKGSAIVDVFLAAGAGASTVRILREPKGMDDQENVLAGLGLPSQAGKTPGLVALLEHNFGSPPVIGLIHHVRQRVAFRWLKNEGGFQNATLSPVFHDQTTREYSFALAVDIEQSTGTTHSETHSETFDWNDEVW